MRTRIFAAALLASFCTLCAAQGAIYESQDKAGPVFSDQTTSGARSLELPPPNVIQSQTPAPTQPAEPAALSFYSALAITTPANGGTIHTNTGAFDLSLSATPALRQNAGDQIVLKLDGNLLSSAYQSTGISVTAADWQGAATDSVTHTLQAAIVDASGNTLIQSTPVTFYAHRSSVREKKR